MKTDPLAPMPATVDETTDPDTRTLDDLFLYQDRYLEDLGFADPIETLGETGIRRQVADQWRAREQRSFPNPGATHSLAVLLYWEARGSGRNGAQLPTTPGSTDRLWTGALVRFAALCASDTFWIEWGVLAGKIEAVRDRALAPLLVDRLTRELETIASRLRETGDHPAAARYEEHLARFRTELEAAERLPALRILSGRGLSPAAIVAGPQLLAEVGMLDKVRDAIAPQQPELLPLFERHAWIRRLVDEGQHEVALQALERVETGERGRAALRALELAALFGGAEQTLQAGRIEDAARYWERGLRLAEDPEPVATRIAETATAEAAALEERGQHSTAIELLERVVTLGQDSAVRAMLGAALRRRAAARIEAVVDESAEESVTEEGIETIREEVDHLERAAALDPGNSETLDVLEYARRVLADLEAGPAAAPPAPVASEPMPDPSPVTGAAPRPQRGNLLARMRANEGGGRPLVFYAGAALWLGITILVVVAYPLVLPRSLGGTGAVLALALAGGWGLANVIGVMALRS